MRLRLVEPHAAEGFERSARAHVLGRQPQRPGELTVGLVVELEDAARTHVREHASRTGVPAGMWLTLAIEGERCLEVVAEDFGLCKGQLEQVLDDAARVLDPTPASELTERLVAYSLALRAAPRVPRTELVASTVMLNPPSVVAARWDLAAQEQATDVQSWATRAADALPGCRVAWETAAALTGRTLFEWTYGQAARR